MWCGRCGLSAVKYLALTLERPSATMPENRTQPAAVLKRSCMKCVIRELEDDCFAPRSSQAAARAQVVDAACRSIGAKLAPRAMDSAMQSAAEADPARAVAFSGAPGANSHRAALEMVPGCLPLPCFSFED